MGIATFGNNPTFLSIQSFLVNAIVNTGAAPKNRCIETRGVVKAFGHSSASEATAFVVLRYPSSGHLQVSAAWRYRLTQASSEQLLCEHGRKHSLDQDTATKLTLIQGVKLTVSFLQIISPRKIIEGHLPKWHLKFMPISLPKPSATRTTFRTFPRDRFHCFLGRKCANFRLRIIPLSSFRKNWGQTTFVRDLPKTWSVPTHSHSFLWEWDYFFDSRPFIYLNPHFSHYHFQNLCFMLFFLILSLTLWVFYGFFP